MTIGVRGSISMEFVEVVEIVTFVLVFFVFQIVNANHRVANKKCESGKTKNVFFWDVSRSGIRVDFRFSVLSLELGLLHPQLSAHVVVLAGARSDHLYSVVCVFGKGMIFIMLWQERGKRNNDCEPISGAQTYSRTVCAIST